MKIVAIANLKGGVGKTTVCTAYASELAYRGERVVVIDADIQQSIARQRRDEQDMDPAIMAPWEVRSITDPAQYRTIAERSKDLDGWLLIDCPGSLRDPVLSDIFTTADAVVVPVAYDRKTADTSIEFVRILRGKTQGKIAFQPNKIRKGVNYAAEDAVRKLLSTVGPILPRIVLGVATERLTTMGLDAYQHAAYEHAVDSLLNIINK